MADQQPEMRTEAMTDRQLLESLAVRMASFEFRMTGFEAFAIHASQDLATIKANQETDHAELMKLVRKAEDTSGTEE